MLNLVRRLRSAALGCAVASACAVPSSGSRPGGPASWPAVDMDGPSCRAVVEGALRSRGGALWFEGPRGPTLLSAGPLGAGRLSRFLPELGGSRAFAVRAGSRSSAGGEELAGDALVAVDPERLALRRIWSYDGPLRLLGRAGSRVVLLAGDGRGGRVVAVDEEAQRITQSAPLPVPEEIWSEPGLELGLPRAAPLGPGGWLLLCRGALCRAQLDDERVEVEQIPLRAEALGIYQGRLLIRQQGGRCLEPGRRPGLPVGRWPRLRPRRCPAELWGDWRPAAPAALVVDGALAAEAQLRVPACRVRGELLLPLRRELRSPWPEPPPRAGGAGVIALTPGRPGRDELVLDLLCWGRRLSLRFVGEDDGGDLPGSFRLALPPGAVLTRQAPGQGPSLVRLRATIPYPPGRCFRGRLLLRATDDGADGAELAWPWRSAGCPSAP